LEDEVNQKMDEGRLIQKLIKTWATSAMESTFPADVCALRGLNYVKNNNF